MKHKTAWALAILSLVFSLLAACSSSSSPKTADSTRAQSQTAPQQGAPIGSPNQKSGDLPSSAQRAPEQANPSSYGGSSTSQSDNNQTFPMDRMIIYTANLSMVVKDPGQTMNAVTDLVNMAGGIIASTSVTPADPSKNTEQTVSMTIRVPAGKYADIMAKLRGLAVKTPEENSSSQDVTEEYSDLQAQERNLEVVEAQYQELMKKAVTIDEILKVQQKLGETQAQIERIKGRMVYLERRSDMATINLSLRPEVAGKETKPEGWDPLRVASEAWEASMRLLQAVATIAITVAVFFWWMLPFILLAIILWRVFRNRQHPAITPGA